MKLTVILVLIGVMKVSANAYSQNTKLTLNLQQATVEQVFEEIKSQSDFSFLYRSDLIKEITRVSIHVDKSGIEKILDQILTPYHFTYEIHDKTVIIRKGEAPKTNEMRLTDRPHADPIEVTGTVTDKNGPLPGASVLVKGTTNGTQADFDGNYTLTGVEENAILVFTYIGYRKQEIAVSGETTINVTLQEDTQNLDEVVVIGYGTMKKSDLTGSVASVKGSEVTQVSSGSVEKLLQGQVSGVTVINNADDNPQGGATVRVRGVSSINGSNAPLVVVDGVPMGDAGNLNSINPNIIASIEVLKDASGTAIYGSRGANGVIMITTKKGTEAKPGVWVNSKVGIGFFNQSLDYWKDPLLMAQLSNESYENAGVEPLYVGKKNPQGIYFPSIAEIREGAWPYHTDWPDHIFRTAITQDHNVGMEGGHANGRYYFNLGYYKGEGIQNKDDYDKISLDVNYNHDINENLAVSTRAGFVRGKRNYNYGMDYGRNPLFPVYNGDGSYFKSHREDYGNPLMMTRERKNTMEDMQGYAILRFDWDITKNLRLSASGNTRAGSMNSAYFNPPKYTYEGDLYNGVGGQSNSNFINVMADTYLTYSKTLASKHQFSIMGGASVETSKTKGISVTGRGFQNQILKEENLDGAETRFIGTSRVETTLLSYFTRLNYTFDNRYLFTFTARADGSSKFGKNNKWAYFPSGAFSWRLSQEEFIKKLDFFDQLKIRTSYGISGNQGIQPYQTFEQFGSTYYYTNGEEKIVYGVGQEIGREGRGDRYVLWGGMENQELGWEKTSQFNIGADMGIFNNRLNLVFDFYIKKTTDLLRQKFLPPSGGYDRVWVNDGEIENKGVELTLLGHVITEGDWKLDMTLMYNANKNKVVGFGTREDSGYNEINGVKYIPYGDGVLNEAYLNVLALGHPINSFFGYQVDGILQNKPSSSHKMLQPGEFNYIGLQDDGTVDPDQRTIIGDPNPEFNASWRFDLSHKSGLDLSVLLYGVYGFDVFSTRKLESAKLQPERWTPESPTDKRPSLRSDRHYYASSWFVEDGSFLRIQDITLGYTLPSRYLKKISHARLYMSIRNPVTFSNVSEYDPEVGENGIGGTPFPRISTLTTGLEIKF